MFYKVFYKASFLCCRRRVCAVAADARAAAAVVGGVGAHAPHARCAVQAVHAGARAARLRQQRHHVRARALPRHQLPAAPAAAHCRLGRSDEERGEWRFTRNNYCDSLMILIVQHKLYLILKVNIIFNGIEKMFVLDWSKLLVFECFSLPLHINF